MTIEHLVEQADTDNVCCGGHRCACAGGSVCNCTCGFWRVVETGGLTTRYLTRSEASGGHALIVRTTDDVSAAPAWDYREARRRRNIASEQDGAWGLARASAAYDRSATVTEETTMTQHPRMLMEARCLTCNAQHSGDHDPIHPYAISQAQSWARGHVAEHPSHDAAVDISYSGAATVGLPAQRPGRRAMSESDAPVIHKQRRDVLCGTSLYGDKM